MYTNWLIQVFRFLKKRIVALIFFLSFPFFKNVLILCRIRFFQIFELFQDENPRTGRQIQMNFDPFVLKNYHIIQHTFTKNLAVLAAAEDGSHLCMDVIPEKKAVPFLCGGKRTATDIESPTGNPPNRRQSSVLSRGIIPY